MWDGRTGTALFELKGHSGAVNSVAFSPDGTRILTGSGDRTVKVWDARTGTELLQLKGLTSRFTCVSFSPDGTRIVSGGGEFGKPGEAMVWDARPPPVELRGHTGMVKSLSFSPDGARIVTGSGDRTAKVWDARTGTTLLDLKGFAGEVFVSFSPDSTRIVSGSVDGTVKVWDARTGTPLLELKAHKGPVATVSFSADGTRIVTGSWDNATKVWDAQTGKELLNETIPKTLEQSPVSPDGRFVARTVQNHVELIPQKVDAEELDYRLMHSRPNAFWYQENYDAARTANDRFAARFYPRPRIPPPVSNAQAPARAAHRRRFQEGINVFQADPLLIARTSFHHPALAKTPYDRGIVALLAVNGDRLAQRLEAQELLRDGKPGSALTLLMRRTLLRAFGHQPAGRGVAPGTELIST